MSWYRWGVIICPPPPDGVILRPPPPSSAPTHFCDTVLRSTATMRRRTAVWCDVDAICLKGVCLLHLLSENIFPALRSNWFYVLMKQKLIWNLSLCYFSLFCFLPFRLWCPNCWAEKWFNLAHVIQTNCEGVSFPQTNQLANSRDAISRHLYYKVFKGS